MIFCLSDLDKHLQSKSCIHFTEGSSELSLENLNEKWVTEIIEKTQKTTNKNVKIQFIRNGQTIDSNVENIFSYVDRNHLYKSLESLDSSIRITNIHTLDPQIKRICYRLSLKHPLLSTANLYITPNAANNCLDPHVDPQFVFAYQVSGSKNWSIIDKKDDLNLSTRTYMKAFKKNHQHLKEVTLKEKQWLYLPYAFPHDAKNQNNQVSVHINFAQFYFSTPKKIHQKIARQLQQLCPQGELELKGMTHKEANAYLIELKEEFLRKSHEIFSQDKQDITFHKIQMLTRGRRY